MSAINDVSILICSHGDERWEELAWSRAYPSTIHQDHDPQVLVVYRREMTLAQVRNHAASMARNPWLCFLDADDELAPGYVAAMTAVLSNPEQTDGWTLPLLTPAVQYVQPDGVEGEPAVPNRGRWPDLNECVIGTVVRADLFERVGGFRELSSLEDYDLWLRCAIAGGRIRYVPDAVYRAHVSTAGRNRDQSIYPRLRAEHAKVWTA